MPRRIDPAAVNQCSHEDQDDTELCHGVGRSYYYFEDDARRATRFPKVHIAWKPHLRKTHFWNRSRPVQAPLSSPIDPTINGGRRSMEFELFDDTYVEFMGKLTERETEDYTIPRKKRTVVDRKQAGNEKTRFQR